MTHAAPFDATAREAYLSEAFDRGDPERGHDLFDAYLPLARQERRLRC